MKTLTTPISIDSRLLHLYRPMVRNLALIVASTIVLAAGALIYFDERMVNSLSERLIVRNAQTTTDKLEGLFETAREGLRIATGQLESLEIRDASVRDELYELLYPYFDTLPFLDSINLAGTDGTEYVMIRRGEEMLTRFVESSAPGTARWRRLDRGRVVEEWARGIDVLPSERPWYQGAFARAPREDYWTEPYIFLTTQDVGISVSNRARHGATGTEFAVAFNVSLRDVSSFTTTLRPTENGMTVVFDSDERLLGLPPDRHSGRDDGSGGGGAGSPETPSGAAGQRALASARPNWEQAEQRTDLLRAVTSLGLPAIDAAVTQWRARGGGRSTFQYHTPDYADWWAGFTPVVLDADRKLWATVLIPESDLLGALSHLRNLSLAGVGLAGLLLATGVFLTSMRSIRRQMSAAIDDLERKLGQYQIEERIASGGNGTVYRARHALLRRPTAIKLMNPEFSRNEAARSRFEHEVQLTSELTHPNTIAIYDYGHTPDGTMYYVMEYLNGRTLDQVVRTSGPQPAGRVIHILAQMAGSLAEAHDKGFIHRDVKPSNAILCERGGVYDFIKVVDFGLVMEVTAGEGEESRGRVLVGTPLYMAPETIGHPGQTSPLSDLYSLGAVAYFLLTGRSVFEGESAAEICSKHLHEQPIAPSVRAGIDLPGDLESLVLKCLEKDPAARPDGAAALCRALLACRDAGSWSQEDARAWWRDYASIDEPDMDAPALSRTEMLVDLDTRIEEGDMSQRA